MNVLVSFVILSFCDSASLFHLGSEPHRKSYVPVSEAIQKLQEVFAFGELPHNITSAKKPPHFMLELYSRVAAPDGSTKAPGLLKGNVVRSFENKVFSETGYPFYFFNISSVRSNERMLKAELRVFKWKPFGLTTKYHFCRVDVYELLDSSSRPWRGNLISSRLLPLHSQGWEVFNVTQTVSRWVGDYSANHGFLIGFTPPSANFVETDPLILAKHKSDSKKSYLVLFSDDGRRGAPNTYTAPIIKYTDDSLLPSEDLSLIHLATHKFPMVIDHTRSRKTRDVYPSRYPPCERKHLYVDFEDIGWAGWIISPKGYNAYHCKGTCLFPMGQGLGATNHATVQSIVHALKLNQDIGTPCCVPDRLNSINLLYFDDEENVVLKQYDDMVATSCGCH
ncbi:PREDICTED: bone morphogenetic protein 2-A-like [Nanorana parkeri]|uniref:bone morphogenetic protein 2-A-like n=1 Tax=Nanorana parkeri TaxID=125878 RepID=UPI0008541608|nr:PREDICTED: bone morphogenetic protein 2-A-like [Nanorana parkeri]